MEQEPLRRRDDARPETPRDHEFLLLQGIEQARTRHRDIDDFTARTISMLLASDPEGSLARFARDGEGRNRELRDEYLPIYHDPDTPTEVRELISWLGSYLVHQDNVDPFEYRPADVPDLHSMLWVTEVGEGDDELLVYVPADTEQATIDSLPGKLAALIKEHGYAMQIFLGLNDVDATDDDLGALFENSYRGTYNTADDAINALLEVDEIMTAVRELSHHYPAAELLRLDEDDLWNRVNDVWTVIEDGASYHVFEK